MVVSWGLNFVSLKVLYRDMTPPAVSLVRFAAMYLLMVLLCKFRGESLRPKQGDLLPILGTGFMWMGVYMVVFYEGLNLTSPAEGAIILATAPVFTYLLAVMLKQEKFTLQALLGAFVAFMGVSIVIGAGAASGAHGSLAGNLLMLFSALLWAIAVVMTRPFLAKYSPTQTVTMSMPGALIVLIPYGARAVIHTDFVHISPFGWLMFAQVAVLSGVIAFSCFNEGIRQVGASVATLYQFFVPPMAALFSWWILGTTLKPIQAVGVGVVIAGVAIASMARMRDPAVLDIPATSPET